MGQTGWLAVGDNQIGINFGGIGTQQGAPGQLNL